MKPSLSKLQNATFRISSLPNTWLSYPAKLWFISFVLFHDKAKVINIKEMIYVHNFGFPKSKGQNLHSQDRDRDKENDQT